VILTTVVTVAVAVAVAVAVTMGSAGCSVVIKRRVISGISEMAVAAAVAAIVSAAR
jgi:hypothetical protein